MADTNCSPDGHHWERGKAILRHRVDRDFTVIPNTVMRESRLSFKAVGLLAYLLHLPPDFQVSVAWLSRQKRTGKHAIRAGINELRALGFMGVELNRSRAGKFAGWIWWVTDLPESQERDEQPKSDFPTSEKPTSENRTLLSTNKKQILKTTTTAPVREANLAWPSGLPDAEKVVVVGLVEGLEPVTSQALLDELAGLMMAGKVKASRIALLRELVARARQGAFTPAHGPAVAARRLQEAQKAMALAEAAAKPKCVVDPALAKIRFAEIARQLRIASPE